MIRKKLSIKYMYKESSPNANFISAIFITVIFQNFPENLFYCISANTLLRPYYTAKRTSQNLNSNIHLLSPQKWSQFVHFNVEKVFPRGQP